MCSALPQRWRSSSVWKSALATRDSTGGLRAARMPPCYHQDSVDRSGGRRIVKELGRGAMGVVYHAMNSRIAWSYDRWELREVRLLRTADFDCSRSGSFRTVFGLSLRFLLAMPAV
jgi:hypothetical protein